MVSWPERNSSFARAGVPETRGQLPPSGDDGIVTLVVLSGIALLLQLEVLFQVLLYPLQIVVPGGGEPWLSK